MCVTRNVTSLSHCIQIRPITEEAVGELATCVLLDGKENIIFILIPMIYVTSNDLKLRQTRVTPL